MFEGVPISVLDGVGVVGVVILVGLVLWRALTVTPKGRRLPKLVTGREAESYLLRAEKAEENLERVTGQNAELVSWAQLGKSTFTALRKNAEELT